MQRYAEESVKTHMSSLQNTFDRHWAGMKPWDNDTLLLNAMKQTDRYRTLKAGGFSEKEIRKNFDKKVPMTVFSWNGSKSVTWSPMDSLKYYFCLLNIGFMAMEPQTGYVRAWVGGYDFDYLQYDHVRSRRQVGSSFNRSSIPAPCKAVSGLVNTSPIPWRPTRNTKTGSLKIRMVPTVVSIRWKAP
jgi:penicillin-binding protein 1A